MELGLYFALLNIIYLVKNKPQKQSSIALKLESNVNKNQVL